ncbi:MAG: hypothetical protein KKA67_03985 [Spirochaetes bacterium]|nr:hypothetical protein [Spirochaetota bacterium]MBU1079446.1 hypothetical protein [Spirochaetota bacterium]
MRRHAAVRATILIASAALASFFGASASADGLGRLAPSAAALALAAGPADPSAEALLEAALLFSGAGPARAEAARSVGLRALEAARELSSSVPDESVRGSRVLELAYSILSRYELLESRLDAALLEGRYNCVGSSSLYAILARAAGLPVRGVILDDHAYCYLPLGSRRVVVETTTPRGYDDPSAVPASGPATDASARDLVALALRNRATLLERSGRWYEALALAADAYAYAPGALTMEALEGRVNNCVANAMREGRYEEAAGLADAALASFPGNAVFEGLSGAARLSAMTDALRKAAPAEALALAEEAARSGLADGAWLERAFVYAYTGLAEESRRSGDHLGAWGLASAAAARFPGYGRLAALERTARDNWVKDVHNVFAALYNAGKYAEALAAAVAALGIAPGEGLLERDAQAARDALAASGG